MIPSENEEEMSESPEMELSEQKDGTEDFEKQVDALVASATPDQLKYMEDAISKVSQSEEFNIEDMPK